MVLSGFQSPWLVPAPGLAPTPVSLDLRFSSSADGGVAVAPRGTRGEDALFSRFCGYVLPAVVGRGALVGDRFDPNQAMGIAVLGESFWSANGASRLLLFSSRTSATAAIAASNVAAATELDVAGDM